MICSLININICWQSVINSYWLLMRNISYRTQTSSDRHCWCSGLWTNHGPRCPSPGRPDSGRQAVSNSPSACSFRLAASRSPPTETGSQRTSPQDCGSRSETQQTTSLPVPHHFLYDISGLIIEHLFIFKRLKDALLWLQENKPWVS